MTGDTYEKRQQHQRRGTDELSRAVDDEVLEKWKDALGDAISSLEDACDETDGPCAVEDALTAMRTTYGSMSEMLRMWHIGQVEIS